MENITDITKGIKSSIDSRQQSVVKIVDAINQDLDLSLSREKELLEKSKQHLKTELQQSIETLKTVNNDLTAVKRQHEQVFLETSNTLQQLNNVLEQKKNLATLVIITLVASIFFVPLAFKLDATSYQNYLEKSCNDKKIALCYNN